MASNITRWEPFRELTRWDPFRELSWLQERFEGMLGDTGGRLREETIEGSAWLPAVGIVEDEDNIVLTADLPGIEAKDVEIQVEDGTLTLRGERKFEKDVKEDNLRRIERAYGGFVRSFTLPRTVDADKIQAEYRNGVLELRLPKRAEAKPKQIKVAVKA